MQRTGFKKGWAVVDIDGIRVDTVSATRRAAIVNWLVTSAGLFIYNSDTDEKIDSLWNDRRGIATVQEVRILID